VGDTQVFPPLWGPQSYNWGAGMHKVDTAAAFIQANMPLGQGGTLSVQDSWDVARFINGHERPQDPRFTGDVAETRAKFHNSQQSLYGTQVNGQLLGSKSH
jgi:thiosulfate dehydrogenase